MTYKEALFFIGKCLTITHEKKNITAIEKVLQTKTVDWDIIVKASTAHYVFPALYLNLKRADFLHYLPKDLVEYMAHITELNRERNSQIITQAKEINRILVSNGITPIFLKGTAFLLSALFVNIAERMVGDIDILVSDEDYLKTIEILKNHNYYTPGKHKHHFFKSRHYSRMIKNQAIAAIEVHNNTVTDKFANSYKYSFFIENGIIKNDMYTPSFDKQIIHNCINKQLSDNGRYYKSITLRNSYDLYNLSIHENPLIAIKKHPHYYKIFNWYLGSSSILLNTSFITFERNVVTSFKVKLVFFIHQYPLFLKLNTSFFNQVNTLKYKLKINRIQTFLNSKGYRDYCFRELKIRYTRLLK